MFCLLCIETDNNTIVCRPPPSFCVCVCNSAWQRTRKFRYLLCFSIKYHLLIIRKSYRENAFLYAGGSTPSFNDIKLLQVKLEELSTVVFCTYSYNTNNTRYFWQWMVWNSSWLNEKHMLLLGFIFHINENINLIRIFHVLVGTTPLKNTTSM